MKMEIVAVTPRSAALCLKVPGAQYHLPRPLRWQISGPRLDRNGVTGLVVTALHDLPPGQTLRVQVQGFADLDLTLPPCAGAVVLDDPAHAQALL
ncbi:MAG: hypothetical protein L0G27_04125, partial [Paracoccus sp. (in: a-proteobacteria)]|nr:hypothetical protein [Paracoccus sp. (in: a-proteobacteria)]